MSDRRARVDVLVEGVGMVSMEGFTYVEIEAGEDGTVYGVTADFPCYGGVKG